MAEARNDAYSTAFIRRKKMYSRKSVGPRIDPCRTPALTGYSCDDFPSRTT